ncbi:MAG: ATP-binding protein [Syntrophorhabdaceae bacterium]|nr:ATP-binding protein [Syntrophorhabdaceae bacterium]
MVIAGENPQLIEPVSTVVLTGGPCSGKSSSLAYLTERLSEHGFMVFVVPETATLITNAGIDRRKMDKKRQVVLFEEAILDLQLAFEETFRKAAEEVFPDKRKVILLDRGIMDIKAFVPPNDFEEMLKKRGLNEIGLRDRYTGVIHLVTAADGAIDYYTGENNTARIESPEESLIIDRRIQESWLGHPRFSIIDNRTDFKGKLDRVYYALSRFLGIPATTANKGVFYIEEIDLTRLPTHTTITIEDVPLKIKDKKEDIRIKKRGQDGTYMFFLKRSSRSGPFWIREEIISEQQYRQLLKLADPKKGVIERERICFIWEHEYCAVDIYKGKLAGIKMLKVESFEGNGRDEEVKIPPFIKVKRRAVDTL